MYKLQSINPISGNVEMVLRLTDMVFIPFNAANADYQKYLEWLEAGNVPEPADVLESN